MDFEGQRSQRLTQRLIIKQREDRTDIRINAEVGYKECFCVCGLSGRSVTLTEKEYEKTQKITTMNYYGNGDGFRLYHAGIHSCSLSRKQYGSGQCVCVCLFLMNVIFHAFTSWCKSVCCVFVKNN